MSEPSFWFFFNSCFCEEIPIYMSDFDRYSPESSRVMAEPQSNMQPWSWHRTLGIAVLQWAGTSMAICLLDQYIAAPLPPYNRLAIVGGCSWAMALSCPFLRRVGTAALREVFRRSRRRCVGTTNQCSSIVTLVTIRVPHRRVFTIYVYHFSRAKRFEDFKCEIMILVPPVFHPKLTGGTDMLP